MDVVGEGDAAEQRRRSELQDTARTTAAGMRLGRFAAAATCHSSLGLPAGPAGVTATGDSRRCLAFLPARRAGSQRLG
jgi:hypothetical protein